MPETESPFKSTRGALEDVKQFRDKLTKMKNDTKKITKRGDTGNN